MVLIAPRVENSGVITTPQGEILLAAGQTVQLVDTANPALRVSVTAPAGEVLNLGRLIADGGRIGIEAGLIGQSGTISADRAEVGPAGQVYLRAARAITLETTSVISASGGSGGQISIDAQSGRCSLRAAWPRPEARVAEARSSYSETTSMSPTRNRCVRSRRRRRDLVGGDHQGANAALRNAQTTEVAGSASLRADAGDTEMAARWSSGRTPRPDSPARSRPVPEPAAATAAWSRCRASRPSTSTARSTRGPRTAGTERSCSIQRHHDLDRRQTSISAGPTFTGTAASSKLNTTTLQNALATNNVVVDTSSAFASAGNISVNNAVTWASGNSLDLHAHNNITVAAGATISSTGTGALRLVADQDFSGAGDVTINAALSAHGGGISISGVNVTGAAAGTLTTTGLASQDGGAIAITAAGAVNLGGAIVTTGGAAGAATAGRKAGTVSIGGTSITSAAITASGSAGNGANQAGGNAATIAISGNGAIATGALTASGGAGGTGTAAGGNAGTITVTNASVATGTLTTGALTARVGAATGAAVSGNAGSITVTNNAAALLTAVRSTQAARPAAPAATSPSPLSAT